MIRLDGLGGVGFALGAEKNILPDGKMRKRRSFLRHVADAPLLGWKIDPRARTKKRTLPSISISPSAISRKPAMASSSVVFPEPDGPKIAVTRVSKVTSMFSSKLASGMRQRSSMSRLLFRTEQPLRGPHEQEGQGDGDSQQGEGFRVFAQLNEVIDRQRQRLGFARYVSGQ